MLLVDRSKNRVKDDLAFSVNQSTFYSNSKKMSEYNKTTLKELVNYIVKLKNDNIINDKQFNDLIYLTCSNFIDNEIDSRIGAYINNKINFLF